MFSYPLNKYNNVLTWRITTIVSGHRCTKTGEIAFYESHKHMTKWVYLMTHKSLFYAILRLSAWVIKIGLFKISPNVSILVEKYGGNHHFKTGYKNCMPITLLAMVHLYTLFHLENDCDVSARRWLLLHI